MKNRLLPLVLALVLCLGLTVPAVAAESTIEETIPCDFANVGPFSEGLAWVEANEKIGFIDKTGAIAIPAEYDEVRSFSEGFAAVAKNDKWGVIDKTGKEVIPCQYSIVGNFSEGLAAVEINGKDGYIDTTGEVVIPCVYDGMNDFSEGLAAVKKGDKYGYIDQSGQEVIPFKYDAVDGFSDGVALVQLDGKLGYIDKTGNEVAPFGYDEAGDFSEGLARVKKNDEWSYIDKTGKEVISYQYSWVDNFSDGLALVWKNEKYGYIDQTGKEVISCQYEDAWGFSEGYAPVMKNDKWGYIDKTGKEVVPFQYDDAATFSDGMARVAQLVPVSGKADAALPLYGYLAITGGTEDKTTPDASAETTVTATVSDWAKELVDSAAANSLIPSGLGDDYRVNITRAQFAAVTVKLYEAMSGQTAPAAGDSPFTDTSDPVIIQAADLGFVGGVGDGKYAPESLLTREQMATMLARVYTKLGGEIPTVDATDFADDASISDYARDAIAFMSGKEIVTGVGDNKYGPQSNASIEASLIIAERMFEKLK